MAYELGGFVPLPLLPNWKQKVMESLEFRTKVLGPTLTGLRQKRRMRIAPRRSFDFEIQATKDNRRLIDNIRFAQGKQQWLLPIWHDRQTLPAGLAAGSTHIPCTTAGYDFNQYVMLRHPDLNTPEFEVAQIASIQADGLDLVIPTGTEWPAASRLFPLRRAVVSEFPKSNNLTDDVAVIPVRFDVDEPCDWTPYVFPTLYRGWPVWEFKHDWAEPRALGFDRIITVEDNNTGLPEYYDLPNKAFLSLNMRWRAKGRDGNNELRAVLYALAGRYRSVWMPTGMPDLQLAANITSAATTISVKNCGYTVFIHQAVGRRDIRIETKTGQVYYRRITGSALAGANETLTISSSLGTAVAMSNVRRISFMCLAQQASDSIMLTHETDANGIATAPFVFEGVVDPPFSPAPTLIPFTDEFGNVYTTENGETYTYGG